MYINQGYINERGKRLLMGMRRRGGVTHKDNLYCVAWKEISELGIAILF